MKTRTMLLLTLIIVTGFTFTINVGIQQTSDYKYNLLIAHSILETGHTPSAEPPIPFILLAALIGVLGEYWGLRYALGLAACLVALPAYLIASRLSGSEEAGLLLAAVAVMNPFSYYLVRYCILKNLVGNLFLLTGMALLHRYSETSDRLNLGLLVGASAALMLSHVISFYTYLAYLASYMAISLINKKQMNIFPILVTLPLILAVPLLAAQDLSLFLGVLPLTFNYPRFVEAWTYLPAATSLYAALNTLHGELRTAPIPTAAALVAVALHLGSWITKHGIGIRLLYMTYIPLTLTLATQLRPSENRRLWLFLAASYIPQYLAHFIPGGWL